MNNNPTPSLLAEFPNLANVQVIVRFTINHMMDSSMSKPRAGKHLRPDSAIDNIEN